MKNKTVSALFSLSVLLSTQALAVSPSKYSLLPLFLFAQTQGFAPRPSLSVSVQTKSPLSSTKLPFDNLAEDPENDHALDVADRLFENLEADRVEVPTVTAAELADSAEQRDKLSLLQMRDLFMSGSIELPDESGRLKVSFMPGVKYSAEQWTTMMESATTDLSRLVKTEFWKEEMRDNFYKNCQRVKDWTCDPIACIPEYFADIRKANRDLKGAWAETPMKALNWCKFGLGTVGYSLGSIFGGALSTSWLLISPIGHLAYRPVAAVFKAGAGTVAAGALLTWNGAAWVMVSANRAVPKPGDMFIEYIPAES